MSTKYGNVSLLELVRRLGGTSDVRVASELHRRMGSQLNSFILGRAGSAEKAAAISERAWHRFVELSATFRGTEELHAWGLLWLSTHQAGLPQVVSDVATHGEAAFSHMKVPRRVRANENRGRETVGRLRDRHRQ